MDFAALRLVPGSPVQLQVAGADAGQHNVKGSYVGCHAGRSVLVAVPARAIGPLLRPGVKVAVSLVTPTGIGSFASRVEAVAAQPYAYLHLHYPPAVALRHVRSAVRVAAELPVTVANLDHLELSQAQPAQMLDISVRGARLGAHGELGRLGDELSLHLCCTFDGITRDLTLIGKIRARPVAEGVSGAFPHVYGVEFFALDEDQRLLLHAFVSHLLAQRGPQI